MTLQIFAENFPLLLINACSGWLIADTLFFYGVRVKPFKCGKCMAFWMTLFYLSIDKYYGADIPAYFIVTLSFTSAVMAVMIDKYMMSR